MILTIKNAKIVAAITRTMEIQREIGVFILHQ